MVLVPSATAGGVPLVLARLVEGLSTHQCAGGPWRLEDRRNCSQVSPCAGRLPSGRGPNTDRPYFLRVAVDERQVRRDADPGRWRRWFGTAIPCRTAGITAWPAPSRSPRGTPRPRRRAGRPGCASDPCSPLIHRRRLPRPIRRQPHQPAGLAHVRLAIRSRTLPIEPPQVPVLAARARRDHELLLRHQSCRCVSSPSASRRPRTASSVPSPTLTTRVP